jgi:kynurenine formamidase
VKAALPAPVEEGDYLLVHTGWADERVSDTAYYLDCPYYAPGVSEFVVESGARGLRPWSVRKSSSAVGATSLMVNAPQLSEIQ